MERTQRKRGRMIPAFIACFYLGLATGWWTHARVAPAVAASADAARDTTVTPQAAVGTSGSPLAAEPIEELRRRHLRLPLDGINVAGLRGQFADRRDGGARGHEAVDMLAPRGTTVRAVEDGRIEKLFTSKAGGLTIYQFDPSGRFCYYYAHLDRYAPALREKQAVRRGDVIGFVGTTGNAPANTPHLHFAIFALNGDRHWWQGRPLDPWQVYTATEP